VTRVVIDPNVLIAALISPRGAPADIYRALSRGHFELVTSSQLLAELERVLQRPKFRRYGSIEDAHHYVAAVARLSTVLDDPPRRDTSPPMPATTTS
jgi:putative PIN family toxin of toxin-antitoxin system